MTELRDCFDILPESHAMRLKGTRVDWEHVVGLFKNGMSPEAITDNYAPILSPEQVYAAITYYLLNKAEYEEYVRRGDEFARQQYEKYLASLTPEQRERQAAHRARLKDLKGRFTDEHGRLDLGALKAYLAEQRPHPVEAGT